MATFWVSGTKRELSGKATLILCGHDINKMIAELKRQGYAYESTFKLTQARFIDIKTRY